MIDTTQFTTSVYPGNHPAFPGSIMHKSSLKGWHIAAALGFIMAFAALCGLTEDARPKSNGLAAEIERALR
jgi:hypothetical protein